MGGIVGALGEVGVFTITYDGPTDVPSRLLGKCPLDNDTARLYNSIMRYYRREAGFYADRILASSSGLRTLRSANETAHIRGIVG